MTLGLGLHCLTHRAGNGIYPLVSMYETEFIPDCAVLFPDISLFQTTIYAVLGVSQATATFFLGAVVSFLSYYASQQLHEVRRTILCHQRLTIFRGPSIVFFTLQ